MKASNLAVNCAMRLRRSSNPKLMLGSESAIEGATAEERGGRIEDAERDDSKAVAILRDGLGVLIVSVVDVK
jgi:hypothetical protein